MGEVYRMSLEDYTETNKTQHEITKNRLANILNRTDYASRLSARELASRLPVGESTVRDLIGELRNERGMPVYSEGDGYYKLEDVGELERVVEGIDEEIETKRETKRELVAAFNSGRYDD